MLRLLISKSSSAVINDGSKTLEGSDVAVLLSVAVANVAEVSSVVVAADSNADRYPVSIGGEANLISRATSSSFDSSAMENRSTTGGGGDKEEGGFPHVVSSVIAL